MTKAQEHGKQICIQIRPSFKSKMRGERHGLDCLDAVEVDQQGGNICLVSCTVTQISNATIAAKAVHVEAFSFCVYASYHKYNM
jgi:hypothetical protein